MSKPWEKVCLNPLRPNIDRWHSNIQSCDWCRASNPHYVPALGGDPNVRIPPNLALPVTGTPQTISDQSNTPIAPVPPSVSLTPVSNLVLYQGPPPIPGPSTIPGLPSTQATYAQWALNRQASRLPTTPRFLSAEAIRDSKEREQQKQLLIQQYAHTSSIPPSFRPLISISLTLSG